MDTRHSWWLRVVVTLTQFKCCSTSEPKYTPKTMQCSVMACFIYTCVWLLCYLFSDWLFCLDGGCVSRLCGDCWIVTQCWSHCEWQGQSDYFFVCVNNIVLLTMNKKIHHKKKESQPVSSMFSAMTFSLHGLTSSERWNWFRVQKIFFP